jgi:hypothetical protein
MQNNTTTPFSDIYNSFLSKLTDDMYMELDEQQTHRLLEELLLSAIQKFEFPRFDITNYETSHEEVIIKELEDGSTVEEAVVTEGHFNIVLIQEEINILATYMVVEWLSQQLASVENTRMKYSGSDFKFTSQANHMAKILNLKQEYEREGFHLQRLYKRRKRDENGIMKSTFDSIMSGSVN